MSAVFNNVGEDLYQLGDQCGILPFMADCMPAKTDMGQTKFRCVIIGQTTDQLSSIQSRMTKKLALQ